MRQKSFPVKVFTVLSALLAGLAVAMLVGGWGWSRPSGTEDAEAARAVRALVTDAPGAVSAVPAGFAGVLGYAPGVRDGRLQRLDGGCTSPWGATSYDFGTACRQHDLGYDLLRYASLERRPLGAWARQAIDGHFERDVAARCAGQGDPVRCRAAARVYVSAVGFNSWRQGWGVPRIESVPALLLPGLVGFAVTSAGLVSTGTGGVRRRLGAALRRAGETPVVQVARDRVWSSAGPWVQQRAGRLIFAAAVLALCLQPVQVPRPLWVQAVVGGAAAANAYLLGSWLRVLWLRVLRRPVRMARVPMAGPGVVLGVAVALLGVAAVSSSAGQLRLDAAVGRPGGSLMAQLPATPLAVLVAALLVAVLVGVSRGVVRSVRTAARTLLRPSRTTRGLAVALLVPGLTLGVVAPVSAADRPTPDASPAGRATGIGPKGQEFLAATPAAGVLPERPVRVYVGRDQARSARERARVAVRELHRAGGFDRAVLLVVVPTGSGWVNADAVSTLERSQGGDVATVVTQYAASPSWFSYVRGGEGVQANVRELLDAVDAEVESRPAGHRPRVLVYGESLGAWGGIQAYPDSAALLDRVDGALWVGVPAGVGLPAGAGLPADMEGGNGRELVVVHPDDPVPAWSPELIVHPTAAYRRGWLPGVSFWRVTADVIAAATTPVGHGHRYGPELGRAWDRLTG